MPIRSVPFVYAVESITIASLCCAVFAMDHFRSVLRSDTLRVSLCVLAAGGFAEEEIIGNITNLQWFLVLAAVPLVLAPVQGATKKQRIFLLAFGILLSLSAPLMILFVPILLIRRVRRIDAFEIGLLFGIVVELVVMVVQGARASAPFGSALAVDNFVFSILVAFTNEVIAFTLLGRRFVFELFRDGYKVFALLLCLTFVSVETVLYKRASPRDR
ncbi:MAG: hypothetical protein JO091_02355, partial [Acidobacteriaceae bacterium]|nr:hypothetical protein [Acidobacteriaceae bacterium]